VLLTRASVVGRMFTGVSTVLSTILSTAAAASGTPVAGVRGRHDGLGVENISWD